RGRSPMSRSRSSPVRRIVAVAALAAAICAGASSGARSETAATLCVGAKPGCFPTVQAALNAAQNGDTVQIGPGTFQGGIVIDKSVNLVGVAAAATIIKGGGPVITVGEPSGQGTPTVSISRVTITGGFNNSKPDQQATSGGGVWSPLAGATVTISNSIITRNRVTPQSFPCGPSYGCATGGGIDNAGTLTVANTEVSFNQVGSTAASPSVASRVRAGGVLNRQDAQLTLRQSLVIGNRVAATPPNGRFAVAGGISAFRALAIDDRVL